VGPAAAGATPAAAEQEPVPSPETLRQLGRRLADRATELDRREEDLRELARGAEVLRRAGLLPPEEEASGEAVEPDATEAKAEKDKPAAAGTAARTATAFQSLQRAYENMEPESAARALAELAARDKQVVVELLLGWKPRTSGAILDALTQTDAALSADLSYEIWKLGREGEPK
jgi:flagellar motility protein MotE (MotC chaperone)